MPGLNGCHLQAGKRCTAIDDSCPYKVRFAVYNLLDEAYIDPLIAAHHAGAGVQEKKVLLTCLE